MKILLKLLIILAFLVSHPQTFTFATYKTPYLKNKEDFTKKKEEDEQIRIYLLNRAEETIGNYFTLLFGSLGLVYLVAFAYELDIDPNIPEE